MNHRLGAAEPLPVAARQYHADHAMQTSNRFGYDVSFCCRTPTPNGVPHRASGRAADDFTPRAGWWFGSGVEPPRRRYREPCRAPVVGHSLSPLDGRAATALSSGLEVAMPLEARSPLPSLLCLSKMSVKSMHGCLAAALIGLTPAIAQARAARPDPLKDDAGCDHYRGVPSDPGSGAR